MKHEAWSNIYICMGIQSKSSCFSNSKPVYKHSCKGDKSLQQNRSDVADYILHTDNEQMSIVHDEKARTKLQINELTLKLDREFAVTSEHSKNLELLDRGLYGGFRG